MGAGPVTGSHDDENTSAVAAAKRQQELSDGTATHPLPVSYSAYTKDPRPLAPTRWQQHHRREFLIFFFFSADGARLPQIRLRIIYPP